MSCASRKEYVLKLEVTLAKFAAQNQISSFHSRIAWMEANLLQSGEIVCCLVWILMTDLGYLKEILLKVECRRRFDCVVTVVLEPGERFTMPKVVHINLFKLLFLDKLAGSVKLQTTILKRIKLQVLNLVSFK